MAHYYCLLYRLIVSSRNLSIKTYDWIPPKRLSSFCSLSFLGINIESRKEVERRRRFEWAPNIKRRLRANKAHPKAHTQSTEMIKRWIIYWIFMFVWVYYRKSEKNLIASNGFYGASWRWRISYRVYCFSLVMLHAIRHSFLWRFFAVSQLDLWLSPADDFARVDRAAELLCN